MTTIDDAIASGVATAQPGLIALSRDLYDHPEIAWEEVRSARRVAEHLSDNGFDVAERYCGLDTAFAARIGSGDLHIALCAEYDALPGLGHACGHNLISAITVGAKHAGRAVILKEKFLNTYAARVHSPLLVNAKGEVRCRE